MVHKLSQFFAQDETRIPTYQDFAQQYQQDPTLLADSAITRHYGELANHLDDHDMDAAHQQAFARLSEAERRSLAQQFQYATRDPSRPFQGYSAGTDFHRMAQPRQLGRMAGNAAQTDPELLGQLLAPDSPLNSASARLALAEVTVALANRYLGKR